MTDDEIADYAAHELAVAARFRELSAELDTVRKLARDMAEALDEATTDLMAEIDARSVGELTRRINRDKSLVKDYRKALTAWQEHEGKQP